MDKTWEIGAGQGGVKYMIGSWKIEIMCNSHYLFDQIDAKWLETRYNDLHSLSLPFWEHGAPIWKL